ncbi:MAG TPA: hypothetical protein VFA26_11995, partial [Gemmataceae bacterium]|nr:hypothetical protein [Gemmataceae bacterium]
LCPEAPEGLAAVVERLMQKSPEARYPSTAEVVEALRPFAGAALAARPAPRLVPASRLVSVRDVRAPSAPPASPHETAHLVARPTVNHRPATTAENPAPPPPPRSSPNINLPTRHSLSQDRPAAPVAVPVPTPAAHGPRPAPVAERFAPAAVPAQPAKRPWDERMGPLGIALCAVLACVVAWFLTYKLF